MEIPQQCDYERDAGDSKAMLKFLINLRHPAQMCQNRGKSPGDYTEQNADFENGVIFATFTTSFYPSGGYQLKREVNK